MSANSSRRKLWSEPATSRRKRLRLDDLEVVGAERADANDAEVVVAEHHRVRRAPLVAGEQARDDEVDVGLEGRIEAERPRLELGEDRDVVGGERVLARLEGVAELAQVDELCDLRLAHDELRAVLDCLVFVGKAPGERVARVVGPFDDVEQLALDEVHDAHRCHSLGDCNRAASGKFRSPTPSVTTVRQRSGRRRPAPGTVHDAS